MIVKAIFDAILSVLMTIFNLLPSVPSFPETLLNSLNTVFSTIFDKVKY